MTFWSFPHSWLITGFVTRVTRCVSLMEQELLTLPEHLSSHPVFIGVRVTRTLVICVYFADRFLYFFFWPLCCLFIYEIRILITPLEYSNPYFKTALAIVPPYFKDKYVPIILFPILSVLMTSTLNLLMILVTILKGILKLVLTYIFSTRDEDCFFSI